MTGISDRTMKNHKEVFDAYDKAVESKGNDAIYFPKGYFVEIVE
jgi:hypothetical protein